MICFFSVTARKGQKNIQKWWTNWTNTRKLPIHSLLSKVIPLIKGSLDSPRPRSVRRSVPSLHPASTYPGALHISGCSRISKSIATIDFQASPMWLLVKQVLLQQKSLAPFHLAQAPIASQAPWVQNPRTWKSEGPKKSTESEAVKVGMFIHPIVLLLLTHTIPKTMRHPVLATWKPSPAWQDLAWPRRGQCPDWSLWNWWWYQPSRLGVSTWYNALNSWI